MLQLHIGDESGIFTVSKLNQQVKALLEAKFPFVWVKGEISNFRIPASGHFYFTLKDAQSQINAVFFRAQNRYLRFLPESGMQVICQARLSVYEPKGEYQLIVEVMEPLGVGQLQLAFEALKKKLEAEGLFDPAKKKVFPLCPQNICLITSKSGAAIRDILKVLQRSPYPVSVTLFPVAVQGPEARLEIAEAIMSANMLTWRYEWDMVIVGRGGGSIEDLWAFNEEVVARAISGSSIPLISAVGHETDFTIADMAADLRMPTPTAAAEWVVKRLEQFHRDLHGGKDRLAQIIEAKLESLGLKLKYLESRITHPKRMLDNLRLAVDDRLERLTLAIQRRVEKERDSCNHLHSRLLYLNPEARIQRGRAELNRLCKELMLHHHRILDGYRLRYEHNVARLEALSPLSVLQRGYSITYRAADGKVIRSYTETRSGDRVLVRLAAGRLECLVDKAERVETEKEG
ncbi:MAG TPA: exodeoxyribonuclease VII large subunit [Syntrophobacteraceae bacterium]|nr:exodeoxyribonuclease VII large subunit [Syntrophobacteraceae bacterium]